MRAFDDLAEASAAIISVLAFPLVQPSGSVVSYESRGREDHMLYYMTSGERTYARNGKAYLRVCAGDILFLPGGSRYTTTVSSAEESRGFLTRFRLMDEEGRPVLLKGAPQRLLSDPDGRLLFAFEELARFGMQSGQSLRVVGMLCRLIDEVIETRRRESLSGEGLEPALRYMRAHLQRPVPLSKLADLCRMSERTFCRRFHAEMGLPPAAYHRRLRVLKAKELLESGVCTVEQTAETLGFADAAHFSRVFLKNMGVSAGSVRGARSDSERLS